MTKTLINTNDAITVSKEHLYEVISSLVDEREQELRVQFLEELRNEEYLTKKQCCFFLNVAPRTVTEMTRNGMLNATYVGSHPMYKKSDVDALINKRLA